MILVGLTGGIGAGKSTVARMLAERGAVIIDADAIVRSLQQPGEPVFDAIVERFGTGILLPDGTLDRAALAARVFAEPDELAALNAIVHPAVREQIARQLEAAAHAEVVVMDIPLIAESTGRGGMTHVITVEAAEDVRLERLERERGMTETEARARMASQASREEREAVADIVVENDGDLTELRDAVDDAWATMTA